MKKAIKKIITAGLVCVVSAVSLASCQTKAGNSTVMLTPGNRYKIIAGDHNGCSGSYEKTGSYYTAYCYEHNEKFKVWKNSKGNWVYSYMGSIY